MPKYYTAPTLKRIAESIRLDLSAQSIDLKLLLSRHLVSHVLVNKDWTRLSPALPKQIPYPTDAAERMSHWLYNRHKPLDQSVCENILNKYFNIKDNEMSTDLDLSFLEFLPNISPNHDWTYLNNFNELGNQNMPVYQEDDRDGRPQSSILLLDPENKTISVQKHIEDGNKTEACGREYIFTIPSEISGRALVSLLQDDKLNDLVESLSESYEIVWNGRDNVGDISEEAQQKINDFREWLSTTQFDCGEYL